MKTYTELSNELFSSLSTTCSSYKDAKSHITQDQ